MAQSRRNESQCRPGTELERPVEGDRAEVAADSETLLDRLGGQQDTLEPVLGHARLRTECWGALRHGTRRSPRPTRRRTLLHLARPSEAPEAHFASLYFEFI